MNDPKTLKTPDMTSYCIQLGEYKHLSCKNCGKICGTWTDAKYFQVKCLCRDGETTLTNNLPTNQKSSTDM